MRRSTGKTGTRSSAKRRNHNLRPVNIKIRGENFIADFYFSNAFNLDIGYSRLAGSCQAGRDFPVDGAVILRNEAPGRAIWTGVRCG